MQQKSLASYLTFEFINIYSPRALQTQKSSEIKLWLCPSTSMPIFSHSMYGGPTEHSKNGLPTVGFPTIHIRVPNDRLHSIEDDESKQFLIETVFHQILEQLPSLIFPSDNQQHLKAAMRNNQKQIDLISTLINTEAQHNHDNRNYH